MNAVSATRNFEQWLKTHIAVVPGQLSQKHKMMAQDPIQFLRGSFYRWAQLFPKVCEDLVTAPSVLSVGDLHIASFGTWRDGFGRLIWGIDDFDESYPLPYANDLIRLAVSAVIDASEGEIGVGTRNVCDAIMDGYVESLKAGGCPFVLEERHKWLRGIALGCLDVPSTFWKTMDTLPSVAREGVPKEALRALEDLMPARRLLFRVARRIAGVGSLGHQRYVAVADWQGGKIALEAKAATPSACAWASGDTQGKIHYQEALEKSVRCPDPFVRMKGKWLVRQLAPDSSPIEIESLKGNANQDRLLHAMAWEAANVHLGTPGAKKRIMEDLAKQPRKWLRKAVKEMATATIEDWKMWKKAKAQ
jgi:hypothetical protein